MFGNFQRKQKVVDFSSYGWLLTATCLQLVEQIDHCLENRIIRINAAAFEMRIIHRKTVLEWTKGQMRTSALREP